jgi:hypothetical protein
VLVNGTPVRSRVRIVGRLVLIAAVACIVCECAAPRNHLYHKNGAAFERAFVLPLNVVATMPRELIGGASRVEGALRGYLSERGKAIETIGIVDARAAWGESVSECRAQAERHCDRFAGVARVLARRLRKHHDYQTLIIPYLLLRSARIGTGSSTARWDGVKSPVEQSGWGFGPDGPLRLFGGDIRAASLKVFAFSAEGTKVFEGIGGLDLVDRVYADGGPDTLRIDVREDLLGDAEMLRAGAALALDPLVPRGDESRQR